MPGSLYDSLMVITPTGAVLLDDVPTAREVMDSKQRPDPAGPPAGGSSKPPAGKPAGNTKKES